MDAEQYMAVGGAVGTGVTVLVVGMLKYFDKRDGKKSSSRPPGRVELKSNPPPGWDVMREQLRELRDWSQDQTREAVHAANARRSIGQIAEALQALVIALDRDRADTQRERDKAQADRREILTHLRDLADVVEDLTSAVSRLEEEEEA